MEKKKAKAKAQKTPKTRAVAVRKNHAPERVDTGGKLIDLAIRRDFDVQRLEKLIDLQERQEKKDAKKEFDIHFARLQAKIQPVVRNKTASNRDGSKMYGWASIAQMQKTFGKDISAEGFSSFWERPVINHETHWVAVTHVLAGYGYEKKTTHEGPILPPTDRQNALQALEGTITYLRRYSFKDALGIVDDEDDRDGTDGAIPMRDADGNTVRNVTPKETKELKMARESLNAAFTRLSVSRQYGDEELKGFRASADTALAEGDVLKISALKVEFDKDLDKRKRGKS